MKFTLNWLEDHLQTDASLDALVDKMIWIGLEVEDVEDPSDALESFTVAEILDAAPHPDADRLKVCRVNTGAEILDVVCGAPNARKGMKGVFAPVNSYVPGIDLKLKKARIRGVDSNGMMLSERELGLSGEHEGIIELGAEAEVGGPAGAALGLDDPVIDIEVTPNRPDTLGVSGIARDLAAAGMGTLKTPPVEPVTGSYPSPIDIGLTFDKGDGDACPMFAGRVIRGLKNGPSPDWLQRRLKAIGLRPINALVDITNYITCDRGRPLHVYDAAKLEGHIHARLGRTGESFLALDGNEYEVDEDMCVIADDAGVAGLGGVIGGERTGSTEETTEVLIECAYFDPLRTARTGRRTGVESDARYRFERGVDPAFVIPGLELATAMVLEICGGEASEIRVAGAPPATGRVIDIDLSEIKRLTGLDVGERRSIDILTRLGCGCTPSDGGYRVAPPSWRPDLEGPACLVEEVARIHGFDKLSSTPMIRPGSVARRVLTPAQTRVHAARRTLAARGLTEAVTWSFVAREHAALFGGGAPALILDNPISSELDAMRPSLLPGLITAIGRNADRGFADAALFEVGPQYAGDEPSDQATCASGVRRGAAGGAGSARHWSGDAAQASAFDVKADVLAVLAACGISPANLRTADTDRPWYHPGRSGAVMLGPKSALAAFGEIHPRVLDALDVAGPVVGFEVDLTSLPPAKVKASKTRPALEASDLPPVERDFAFVVDAAVAADTLIRAARSADKKLITRVALFDVFEDRSIGKGKKSLAISVTLQPREKTLTDADIEAMSAKVVGAVQKATGGVLRS